MIPTMGKYVPLTPGKNKYRTSLQEGILELRLLSAPTNEFYKI